MPAASGGSGFSRGPQVRSTPFWMIVIAARVVMTQIITWSRRPMNGRISVISTRQPTPASTAAATASPSAGPRLHASATPTCQAM